MPALSKNGERITFCRTGRTIEIDSSYFVAMAAAMDGLLSAYRRGDDIASLLQRFVREFERVGGGEEQQ